MQALPWGIWCSPRPRAPQSWRICRGQGLSGLFGAGSAGLCLVCSPHPLPRPVPLLHQTNDGAPQATSHNGRAWVVQLESRTLQHHKGYNIGGKCTPMCDLHGMMTPMCLCWEKCKSPYTARAFKRLKGTKNDLQFVLRLLVTHF